MWLNTKCSSTFPIYAEFFDLKLNKFLFVCALIANSKDFAKRTQGFSKHNLLVFGIKDKTYF